MLHENILNNSEMNQDIENILFTELTDHNPKVLSVFSPEGHLIASAVQNQLHVWNVKNKEIAHKFECDNVIDFIRWSPDSELICCGMLKDFIQVWNLDMTHWRCKINGCLAFINVHWSPNSQCLLVISEFYIKATVFSFVSNVITEIDNPKAIENGIAVSPCDKFVVIAQRMNCDDHLGVYSTETWETIKTFPVDTKDFMSTSFSPTDLMIAVLENAVIEYKVLFYSIDGRLVGKYLSDVSFGPISISWNITKNLVALGDCLGEVKILDYSDFEVISSYLHLDTVESSDVTLYKAAENVLEIKSPSVEIVTPSLEIDEVVKSRPVSIIPLTPDVERGKGKNPLKCGVHTLLYSMDGKYISSISGNMPKAVFIYDVEKSRLCDVIMRSSNVKSICWHPVKPYLIICSSSNVFDMWTPDSCIRYISPFIDDFPICNAAWSPTGETIILNSRDHFSVVYFT